MKPKNSGKPYTSKDIKIIKEAKSGKSTEDIAKETGRTEDAIREKAYKEGISLNPKDK